MHTYKYSKHVSTATAKLHLLHEIYKAFEQQYTNIKCHE